MRSSPSNMQFGQSLIAVCIAGCCTLNVVQEEVGKLGHDLDNGLVTDELLDIAREIQNEEAGNPVRLYGREDQNGDLLELVEPVLEGNKTLRQKVEILPVGWPYVGQPRINDLVRAVLASSSLCRAG